MTDQLQTTADIPVHPSEPPERAGHTRRGFFVLSGAAGAAVLLVACGDDGGGGDSSSNSSGSSETTQTTETSAAATDVSIATFAAGLELLAANTYAKALEAANGGKLGAVPPAVASFATTAQSHHQAASDALAKAAGGITPEVPADLQSTVDQGFAGVKDVMGLANFALDLEEKAGATYVDVIPKLSSKAAIDLAGSILPITRQHVAILLFVLGKYPVPDTFATAEDSLAPKS